MADFVPSTHQGLVVVTRDEGDYHHEIKMTPAEVDKATEIIGFALSMVELPGIPDHIKNTPFVVRCFKKKIFALERSDKPGSMPFRSREGDDLIKKIRLARGMCINEQTHGRVVYQDQFVPDDTIGREPI